MFESPDQGHLASVLHGLAGFDAIQRQQMYDGQNSYECPAEQEWCRRPDGHFHGLSGSALAPAHQDDQQDAEPEYTPGDDDLAGKRS